MHAFQITSLPTEIAEAVRATGRAPQYGFPAHKEMASGRAPCRHCLRLIRVNEEQLFLFTYDPFENVGAPPLPGPVYLHADHCERSVGATAFPEEYRGRALTFAAYGDDRALLAEVRLKNGQEEEEAGKLFANLAVKYIDVRSTDAGCYLFRLDRA